MNWLIFALMTVVSWGLYGIFLHSGQVGMQDKANGLFKAFLFVGLAYFLTAVLAPLAMLVTRKAIGLSRRRHGVVAAGRDRRGGGRVLRAAGFRRNGGTPGVVMSIVFAGAPVVNAVVAIYLNPPEGGLGVDPMAVLSGHCAGGGGRVPGDAFQAAARPATAPAPPRRRHGA